MNVLALVTARGGSKGFPGKNLALLGGQPLVERAHSILSQFRALHPGTRLFLSTDRQEIADTWPREDRPRRLRPDALATDIASSLDVVLHELEQQDREGFHADAVLLLQPTTPLLDIADLERAWRLFETGAESVPLMTQVEHPIQWVWRQGQDGFLSQLAPTEGATRRQDLESFLRPIGCFLVARKTLEDRRSFIIPGLSRASVVPLERSVDIDSADDLEIARMYLRKRSAVELCIGGKKIGKGQPCFVIAEAGVNHNGDLTRALEMVHRAAEAGADAVKFQTFRAEKLVTSSAPKADYQVTNTGEGGGQLEMLKRLELGLDGFNQLKRACQDAGIIFMSTPFESESAQLLDRIGVEAFKLGSGELTNLPYLREIASFGKPVILSTGMGTMQEVVEAVAAIREAGNPPLMLLHCLSAYPAPTSEYNLRAMATIEDATDVPVGVSDHTMGWEISLGAVALGAKVIEKHFTLDRNLPGPDHSASLEPGELKRMIDQIRHLESALGDGIKRPMPSEMNTREVARKSLVALSDLPAGISLSKEHLTIKRPGTGISPADLERVIGLKLKVAIQQDQVICWDHLDGER